MSTPHKWWVDDLACPSSPDGAWVVVCKDEAQADAILEALRQAGEQLERLESMGFRFEMTREEREAKP
jgi:hypothetical protein